MADPHEQPEQPDGGEDGSHSSGGAGHGGGVGRGSAEGAPEGSRPGPVSPSGPEEREAGAGGADGGRGLTEAESRWWGRHAPEVRAHDYDASPSARAFFNVIDEAADIDVERLRGERGSPFGINASTYDLWRPTLVLARLPKPRTPGSIHRLRCEVAVLQDQLHEAGVWPWPKCLGKVWSNPFLWSDIVRAAFNPPGTPLPIFVPQRYVGAWDRMEVPSRKPAFIPVRRLDGRW